MSYNMDWLASQTTQNNSSRSFIPSDILSFLILAYQAISLQMFEKWRNGWKIILKKHVYLFELNL